MKNKIVAIALILGGCAIVPASGAPADSEVLTLNGGVICTTPFKLSEGIKAANAHDAKWLADAGCVQVQENLRAIRIDPLIGIGNPWQVRIYMDNENGVTVWGYSSAFKRKSGKKFWPD